MDEILNLIESVSEGFPSYFFLSRRRGQTQKDASAALNLVSIYSDIRRVFFYLNNLKDLDSSCKTDLDFWDCFWKENTF